MIYLYKKLKQLCAFFKVKCNSDIINSKEYIKFNYFKDLNDLITKLSVPTLNLIFKNYYKINGNMSLYKSCYQSFNKKYCDQVKVIGIKYLNY